jgi:hypothetical protein
VTDSSAQIAPIRALYESLKRGRQEFDFQSPAFVSHVQAYAGDPVRLANYARQTIGARVVLLQASSRMATQSLLHAFLAGVETENPFVPLLVARSQIELYSLVADTLRILKENAGTHEADFVTRVEKVDKALVNATFGTRSPEIKELLPKLNLSRRRATEPEDLKTLDATNTLTRLQRLTKDGTHSKMYEEYERLCEFAHPNWGMNMAFLVAHPTDDRLSRLSLMDVNPFQRALHIAAEPMNRAASATIDAFVALEAPFGAPTVTM